MTPNERVGRILWVGTPVGAILGTLLYYYLEDQKKIQKLPEVVRGAHTVRCPLSSERLALSLARHSPCLPFSVCAIANFCKRGRAQVLACVRAVLGMIYVSYMQHRNYSPLPSARPWLYIYIYFYY